ncbi:MAG: TolC family protein, partial [bacterium]
MNITVYGLIAVTCGLFPVLTGCVQAPPPASRTEAWIPPAGQAADPVWRDLRAGLPDLSRPLSLFSLTDLALENNPATARAWHEARAASEQVRYAEGYFMPSVTAGAGLTRQTTAAHPDSFDANTLSYGPGLQLSYLVCNFGGGRNAAVEQALQTVYAANFAFNQAIQDTLLNVQTAYYGVISARALAEAAQTNSLDAKAILEAASDRRDAGLGVDLDVLQAQTSYDQSRYALVAAEGQVKTAEGLLAQALHLPADTGIRVIPPATALLESLSGQDLRRLTDEALARHCIRLSQNAPEFLTSCGVVFQPSLSGTLSLSRTNAFFLGGGKALLNALYRTAEAAGVVVLYDTEVQHLEIQDGFFKEALVSYH